MGTPHDELFRRVFSTPEQARAFVRVALPEHIRKRLNLDVFEIRPGSYVDRGLRPSQSDLLIETSTRGRQSLLIYILVEHKSAPDRKTLYQLLRYMVAIWDGWTSREENRGWRYLPPIIPVVFSNSPREWSYPLEFAALVQKAKGLDLRSTTPNFSAVLLDLAVKEEGELGQAKAVNAVLRVMKHLQAGPFTELLSALAAFAELRPSEREGGLWEAVLTYVFQGRQGESVRGILEALPSGEFRRKAMTIAERLEKKGRREGLVEGRVQGRAEGRTEGRTEGRIEEKQEVLGRLVERKFGLTDAERKAIRANRNPEELDAAIDAVVPSKSKGEVLGHLR